MKEQILEKDNLIFFIEQAQRDWIVKNDEGSESNPISSPEYDNLWAGLPASFRKIQKQTPYIAHRAIKILVATENVIGKFIYEEENAIDILLVMPQRVSLRRKLQL